MVAAAGGAQLATLADILAAPQKNPYLSKAFLGHLEQLDSSAQNELYRNIQLGTIKTFWLSSENISPLCWPVSAADRSFSSALQAAETCYAGLAGQCSLKIPQPQGAGGGWTGRAGADERGDRRAPVHPARFGQEVGHPDPGQAGAARPRPARHHPARRARIAAKTVHSMRKDLNEFYDTCAGGRPDQCPWSRC